MHFPLPRDTRGYFLMVFPPFGGKEVFVSLHCPHLGRAKVSLAFQRIPRGFWDATLSALEFHGPTPKLTQ